MQHALLCLHSATGSHRQCNNPNVLPQHPEPYATNVHPDSPFGVRHVKHPTTGTMLHTLTRPPLSTKPCTRRPLRQRPLQP
jgi:hypothetical protein